MQRRKTNINTKAYWRILAKGIRIFGSEENFKKWLNAINQALGNQKPIELLKDPHGIEMVDNAIEAPCHGVILCKIATTRHPIL